MGPRELRRRRYKGTSAADGSAISAQRAPKGDTGRRRQGHPRSTSRTGTFAAEGRAICARRAVRGRWRRKAGPSALDETWGDVRGGREGHPRSTRRGGTFAAEGRAIRAQRAVGGRSRRKGGPSAPNEPWGDVRGGRQCQVRSTRRAGTFAADGAPSARGFNEATSRGGALPPAVGDRKRVDNNNAPSAIAGWRGWPDRLRSTRRTVSSDGNDRPSAFH